jgi:hypothetical protein
MTLLLCSFVVFEGKTRKSGEKSGRVVSHRGLLRRARPSGQPHFNQQRHLTISCRVEIWVERWKTREGLERRSIKDVHSFLRLDTRFHLSSTFDPGSSTWYPFLQYHQGSGGGCAAETSATTITTVNTAPLWRMTSACKDLALYNTINSTGHLLFYLVTFGVVV